ncbi:MAG: hypothetical protein NC334_08645 [Bacteroides sp.]|nr:hypothetical protein [Bacteroides sp.]
MKRVLLFLGIMLSTVTAFADENVLQSIEIEPVKDTYNIVLVSDKAVDVKKVVQAPNKITLNMKDIRPSKSLNTIYNNVSNVDTVMVEPQGNGISIYFQADNASAATVTFDALAPAVPVTSTTTASKNLKLNNPIESYAPIYTEDYENVKTSKLFDKLKSSTAVDTLKDTIDEDTASDFGQKAFSFGLLIVLGIGVLRLFRRKDSEMKIGLSQSLNEREINMYRGTQPIPQTYANVEKPFTTVNYGLNAYQKENRNPYEAEPMKIHNPKLRNYATPQVQNTVVTRPVQAQPVAAVQAPVKKLTTPVNNAPVNQSNPNIDNLKFLESMTAIYEKSGRHDLARGLRASLNKNNIQ